MIIPIPSIGTNTPSRLELDVQATVRQDHTGSTEVKTYSFPSPTPQTMPIGWLAPSGWSDDGQITYAISGRYYILRREKRPPWNIPIDTILSGRFDVEILFLYGYNRKDRSTIGKQDLEIEPAILEDKTVRPGSGALIPRFYATLVDGQSTTDHKYVRVDISVIMASTSTYHEDSESWALDAVVANYGGGRTEGKSLNLPANEKLVGTFKLNLDVKGPTKKDPPWLAEAKRIQSAIVGVVTPGTRKGFGESEVKVDGKIADDIRFWIGQLNGFDDKYKGKLPSIREAPKKGDISIKFVGYASNTGVTSPEGRRKNDQLSKDRAENVRKWVADRLGLTSTALSKTSVEAKSSDQYLDQPIFVGKKPPPPKDLDRSVHIILDEDELGQALGNR